MNNEIPNVITSEHITSMSVEDVVDAIQTGLIVDRKTAIRAYEKIALNAVDEEYGVDEPDPRIGANFLKKLISTPVVLALRTPKMRNEVAGILRQSLIDDSDLMMKGNPELSSDEIQNRLENMDRFFTLLEEE